MSELRRDEIEEIEQTEEKIPFSVDSDDKAEWCLKKIKEHQDEITKWTAHYEAEKRRAVISHENAIFRLEGELRSFFVLKDQEGLTRQTKTQTAYNLPSGKIFIKRQNPEFERDDAEIIDWLRVNAPELIKTKEEVDWAAMKAAYAFDAEGNMTAVNEETGEIINIPGVKAKTRDDVFKVEVSK